MFSIIQDYETVLKTITCIVAVGSFVAGFGYFLRSHSTQIKIAKATLIEKLHQDFEKHSKLLLQIEDRLKGAPVPSTSLWDTDGYRSDVREVLRLMEFLMLLLESKLVKPIDIFPLFAVRIFIVVNNEEIRKEFLFNDSGPRRSCCAIFALHHKLLQYFTEKYGAVTAPSILKEIHVTRESDLSWSPYYKQGVESYVFHRKRPLTRWLWGFRNVKAADYSDPGWPCS